MVKTKPMPGSGQSSPTDGQRLRRQSLPGHCRCGWYLPLLVVSLLAVTSLAGTNAGGAIHAAELTATWSDRFLTIRGDFPGEEIRIHYLEAYCRAGSTNRDWQETVIPHESRLLAEPKDGVIAIEDRLADGVVVNHRVIVEPDGISFVVTATNPSERPSAVHWAQPCVRVDRFIGSDPAEARERFPAYIKRCFVAVDGTLVRLPTTPWAVEARYVPGQVYCPAAVPRDDVNPRPLSQLVPSHGLCGCVSADDRWVLGVAWEPYQEVFQGVVTCMHTDFAIGGLAAGETKTIRGRLYLLTGDEQALLAAYRRDFPAQADGLTVRAAAPGATAGSPLATSLDILRQVGPEGRGNPQATAAWQQVAAAPAADLPEILAAIDGASSLAANWLRLAVDAIAGRSENLPLKSLEGFLADTNHDPRARRLAWELIRGRAADRAEQLIGGMLDDPSVELRYDAVARLIERAMAERGGDAAAATAALKRALDAARDVDQIKAITAALRKVGEAVDLQRQFGFLADWQVIGPFDNTGGAGFAKVFPPEQGVDLKAAFLGKLGEVGWKRFLTADPYGMVDINQAYPGPGDGLKEVTAYAFTSFDAARAQLAEIRLGCKNAWKIWHNGSFVFGRDEYHRGMRIDQYRLPIELAAGRNTFLIKLCQDGQTNDWTKQWQFQLRICDATGTAILATDRPPTPTAAAAEATHGKEILE